MMMEPRLKNSVKKTDLPLDYIKMVKDVIGKNFKKYLKDLTVVVEGAIYTEEVLVRIGFRAKKGVKQMNFEASVMYSLKTKNIMDQIYLALDGLGAMIDQYFQAEGDLELPTLWTEFVLDQRPVYLQTSTENSELEDEANKILKDSHH
jgi:hypothetical protein